MCFEGVKISAGLPNTHLKPLGLDSLDYDNTVEIDILKG